MKTWFFIPEKSLKVWWTGWGMMIFPQPYINCLINPVEHPIPWKIIMGMWIVFPSGGPIFPELTKAGSFHGQTDWE
jgi:hypothetical protein